MDIITPFIGRNVKYYVILKICKFVLLPWSKEEPMRLGLIPTFPADPPA